MANSCAVFLFQAPSKWCSLDCSRKERHGFCEIHVRVFLLCDSSEWRVTASGFSIARLSRRDSDWCTLQVSICSSFSFSWCGGLLRFWRSISSLTAYADSLRYDRYAWTVGFWNFFNRQILEIPTDRHMKVGEKTVWFWKRLRVQSKVLVNWDLWEVGIGFPTCHVMVSMALTNQRRPRKGRNTPYAPDHEWKVFPARLKEGRKSVPALF